MEDPDAVEGRQILERGGSETMSNEAPDPAMCSVLARIIADVEEAEATETTLDTASMLEDMGWLITAVRLVRGQLYRRATQAPQAKKTSEPVAGEKTSEPVAGEGWLLLGSNNLWVGETGEYVASFAGARIFSSKDAAEAEKPERGPPYYAVPYSAAKLRAEGKDTWVLYQNGKFFRAPGDGLADCFRDAHVYVRVDAEKQIQGRGLRMGWEIIHSEEFSI